MTERRIRRITGISSAWLLVFGLLMSACTSAPPVDSASSSAGTGKSVSSPSPSGQSMEVLPPGPAGEAGPSNTFYEIFVRSFADSNGDGIGDLNGVAGKLDYLKALGVDGIWLMPIQPSPSYHGYDVTDYYGINKDYGTPDDLIRLLDEAHRKGIRVIMDLVINHTSSEHPWFLDSSKGGGHRKWYVWANDIGGASPADGAVGPSPWHDRGDDQYLGVFWEGMPDLNFDNPEVRKEMIAVGQYWLEMGIDGFRLDAAKHIYGDFGSTINRPAVKDKNKIWWQEFRKGMDEVKPDAYLVGEVWDSTAVVGPYLDHALDSAFNFDLSDRLLSAADTEQAQDIGFSLSRAHDYFAKMSGGKFIDAPFLSNHDKDRVMTKLSSNADHARMAAAMLLTMPGNAFIYYGEELGMEGAKPDENIREPFPWTRAEGTPGETTWMEPRHRGDGSASVEAEDETPDSLLNLYRTLISWRAHEPALREGAIGSYESGNPAVLTYVRTAGEEKRLVAHNLSGQPQTLKLAVTKALPVKFATVELATRAVKQNGDTVEIPPYTTVVLKP